MRLIVFWLEYVLSGPGKFQDTLTFCLWIGCTSKRIDSVYEKVLDRTDESVVPVRV